MRSVHTVWECLSAYLQHADREGPSWDAKELIENTRYDFTADSVWPSQLKMITNIIQLSKIELGYQGVQRYLDPRAVAAHRDLRTEAPNTNKQTNKRMLRNHWHGIQRKQNTRRAPLMSDGRRRSGGATLTCITRAIVPLFSLLQGLFALY